MNPLRDPEPLIRRVYAYVAYRIGAGPDAEDVTNDVFERALRYRESYDRRKGSPASWLIGIARRVIDDFLSARPAPAGTEDTEPAAPGDLEEQTATRLRLRAAVQQLGGRERELIALRYGADLTAREIGELLEMKTNAVEVAIHRALQRLRAQLELDDAGHAPRAARGKTPVRAAPLPAVVGVQASIPAQEGRKEQ